MSRYLTADKASCEALCKRTYGCTVAEYWAIRGDVPYQKSPVAKYIAQKRTAAQRGIEWQFDLLTWWNFWQDSGLWEKRGKSRGGYVMSRFGDVGPYSPFNVHICLGTENSGENIRRVMSRFRWVPIEDATR